MWIMIDLKNSFNLVLKTDHNKHRCNILEFLILNKLQFKKFAVKLTDICMHVFFFFFFRDPLSPPLFFFTIAFVCLLNMRIKRKKNVLVFPNYLLMLIIRFVLIVIISIIEKSLFHCTLV